MQAVFLMRSARKKLVGYGQNAQQRCRKDLQEILASAGGWRSFKARWKIASFKQNL